MKRFALPLVVSALACITRVVHRDVPWTPTRIGDELVLEGDVHVHTSIAGALATPIDVPGLAARHELDFIAVTEHNSWLGGAVARAAGRVLAPNVIVLPSEEITNREYHLLAIGLSSRIDPNLPLARIGTDVHAQGGVLVAAHPTRETWPLLLGLAQGGALDGTEIFHPSALGTSERSVATLREYEAFAAEAGRLRGAPIAVAGSSDYHGGGRLGAGRTLVFAQNRSATAILDAFRAGRTVAAASDGRLVGPPDLVAALRASGHRIRAHEAPRTSGLERVLAWLTALVLVLGVLRAAPRE